MAHSGKLKRVWPARRRKMRDFARAGIAFVLASIVTLAPPVRAQSPSSTPAPAPSFAVVTELHVLASPAMFGRLKAVVGEQSLGLLQLRWLNLDRLTASTLLNASLQSAAIVRCFIDLSQPTRATLYFADGTSRRFLFRELPISRGLDAVELETVAQILELGIGALLDESTSTLSRVEAEALLSSNSQRTPVQAPNKQTENLNVTRELNSNATAGASAPTLVTPPYLRAFFAAQFALQSRLHELGLASAIGATIGMVREARQFELRFGVRASYLLPQTRPTDWITPALDGFDVLATGSVQLPLAYAGAMRHTSVGIGFAVGLERLHLRSAPGSLEKSTTLSAPAWATVPVIVPSLRLEHRFAGRATLALETTITLTSREVTYELGQTSGANWPVLQTRTWRPGLLLAVGWN